MAAGRSTTFSKQTLVPGSGPQPRPHQKVTVAADLYLAADNKGIWSTHQPAGFLFPAKNGPQPFTYETGAGSVIPGWEDGVSSMQLGEKARLHIPWQYAYGANGHPGFKIPGKADLIFDITLISIQ